MLSLEPSEIYAKRFLRDPELTQCDDGGGTAAILTQWR